MSEVAALEVRGLTRRFGARVAVDDLHLTVLPGDVYGFLGPNGAGKTTAMRCMMGLIRKDAGEVTIFGERDAVVGRSLVGAIIETPAFHGWMSGRDNLEQAAAYAAVTRSRVQVEIDRVLDRVGLVERAKDRVRTYSLGMKQRLAIARALLGRPRLLLLDEPTNGLDPRGMREMRDLIRSLALHDRITIFVSSHLLSEVQAICNRVGILQAGRLRAEGQVEELLGLTHDQPVIEVGGPDPAAIEAAVAAIPGCALVGPGPRGRLLVRLDGVAADEVNRQLVAAGVAVAALVPSERNLEDVFMEVTT
jgi:ABC-type multidrug transport system ATPase subunit